MDKKFFLIAGEPSGDSLGAGLMRGLKGLSSDSIEFIGIGGDHMVREGLTSLLPMREISVMGITEVLSQLPRMIKLVDWVVQNIEQQKPDVVITVDFQEFNFHVAQKLKKRRIYKGKIVHYVAPTVWAWRPGRAEKAAKVYDALLCLFHFEPPYFEKFGLKTVHVGHPIIESDAASASPEAFKKKHKIPEHLTVLGVFPGSREKELSMVTGVFEETFSIINETFEDLCVVVPTLPSLEYELFERFRGWPVEPIFVSDPEDKYNAFAACDVAMAVSGTVGLELAYIGVPHVITYKMSALTGLCVKHMVKVKYAHLANILLDEAVVPEYLQKDCDSIKISEGVLRLLKHEDVRAKQIEKFKELGVLLDAVQNEAPSVTAAKTVLDVLEQSKTS